MIGQVVIIGQLMLELTYIPMALDMCGRLNMLIMSICFSRSICNVLKINMYSTGMQVAQETKKCALC